MKKHSLSYYLGNLLLLVSFLSFLYIFWPIIQIYLFPSAIAQHLPEYGTFISIPKIHAESPVILGVVPCIFSLKYEVNTTDTADMYSHWYLTLSPARFH